jgi:hypothetical protein
MVGEATKIGKNRGILKPSWAFIETNNINEAGPKIFRLLIYVLYIHLKKKSFFVNFRFTSFRPDFEQPQSAWAVVRH